MKAKHLESFLPHNMTPDEVLDNYGTDGAALPIIMASQAYAAEFPSLKEALRTDNLSFQLDRHEAETATRQLEDQFKALLGSYYFEPRSLQHFLIGYWWRDISHENVRDALIGEGLLDDPDTVYDEEETRKNTMTCNPPTTTSPKKSGPFSTPAEPPPKSTTRQPPEAGSSPRTSPASSFLPVWDHPSARSWKNITFPSTPMT